MDKAAGEDFQAAMIYSSEHPEMPLIFGPQRLGAAWRRRATAPAKVLGLQ
jgi:hypothetical protein